MLLSHFREVQLYHRVGKGEDGAMTLEFINSGEILSRNSHWLRLSVNLVFRPAGNVRVGGPDCGPRVMDSSFLIKRGPVANLFLKILFIYF